jgi:hypothetical protein
MATNGNGVFFKWAAGGLAIACAGVVAFAANGAKDTMNLTAARVDTVDQRVDLIEGRMSRNEVDQAKMMLQLAGIAKALDVPVVLDTARAKRDSS